jgi:hypothetical protein
MVISLQGGACAGAIVVTIKAAVVKTTRVNLVGTLNRAKWRTVHAYFRTHNKQRGAAQLIMEQRCYLFEQL